ncbi:8-amino-7-oxononanoate synthase [Natrialba magadii ATCC 43099]|uniref:8-amino-7-oxononanoate synthase n=1 Tax=Natrialba magadii (strain ATCC 43099 / DSM 3394 / CCM 3739 / CIP 104546 / IAM 13178 / JCM 8861 / NBRC 102185 / NCIMB 2190 / MS3) TaxID=547559 RepID=D3SZI2_NATMM|nr:aminotransferase class I/II-fold pyridoxal phosphate-dependent enzyme [Natrialba magadii]ADD04316.1 8-amino-7-oxononanoate synthase [Natrialba magadii ATCC 43099]ELY26718.1 8-amino-7-oxononanoate synthase [Natrialba magadii ATCC 43099]
MEDCDRGFDLEARLGSLEERAQKRTLSPVDRVAERGYFADAAGGDLPVLDTDEALVFSSNNYLGLTDDQRVQDAARQAAATVGTGAGASRIITGDTMVHHDLERLLAETKGTERALAFSSGYAANVGTITALEPDVIFSDERNHASLIDGCRLADCETIVYDHCDPASLRDALESRAAVADSTNADAGTEDESWLIVTDTVFSVDGTVAPLSAICDLAEEFGAWVMVDEAHATGLYADGGGVVQAEGLEDRVHIQMGTLSKALASQGGYVAGSDALIESLLNEARSFAFSTGLAPTAAAAASEALHLARHSEAREQLWENVAHLRDGLETMGFSIPGESQILPVIVGDQRDALAFADGLRARGIVVPPIRPPAVPEGESRLRVAPIATHDRDDIITCLESFRTVGSELGLL